MQSGKEGGRRRMERRGGGSASRRSGGRVGARRGIMVEAGRENEAPSPRRKREGKRLAYGRDRTKRAERERPVRGEGGTGRIRNSKDEGGNKLTEGALGVIFNLT